MLLQRIWVWICSLIQIVLVVYCITRMANANGKRVVQDAVAAWRSLSLLTRFDSSLQRISIYDNFRLQCLRWARTCWRLMVSGDTDMLHRRYPLRMRLEETDHFNREPLDIHWSHSHLAFLEATVTCSSVISYTIACLSTSSWSCERVKVASEAARLTLLFTLSDNAILLSTQWRHNLLYSFFSSPKLNGANPQSCCRFFGAVAARKFRRLISDFYNRHYCFCYSCRPPQSLRDIQLEWHSCCANRHRRIAVGGSF